MLPHRLLLPWLAVFFGCASPPSSAPLPARQALAQVPRDVRAATGAALQRNAELEAVRERALAEAATALATGRLPNPKLVWTEFAEALQTRTGPHVRRLGLQQKFPWPGTLDAAKEVATAAARQAQGWSAAAQAQTQLHIESAWIERAQLATEHQLQSTRVELLESLEPVVAARTRTGAGQQDVLRLEIETARAKDHLLHLEESRAPLDTRLAELLAIDNFRPEIQSMGDPADLDLPSDLEARVLTESPRLAPLVARIAQAKATARLRTKQRLPSLGLGLDWLQVDDALSPQTPGSGEDPYAVRVEIGLPLWTRQDDATERAAVHALRATHLEFEAMQRELRTELSEVLFAATSAQRTRHLHRDVLIPRMDESLRLLTSAYRSGTASLLDLIETERLRLDLLLAHARAGTDQRLALARLRALLGESR